MLLGAPSLKTVALPPSAQKVLPGAFSGLQNLRAAILGPNLEELADCPEPPYDADGRRLAGVFERSGLSKI